MSGARVLRQFKKRELFPLVLFVVLLLLSTAEAADVLVIGDTRLSPVVEIISGIRETLDATVKVYSPSDARDRLNRIAQKEDAKVVVALGREALQEALRLPASTPVIYDLVVTPPPVSRPNTTGFYMATPVREYSALIRRYIPSVKRIAVVGSSGLLRTLEDGDDPQVMPHRVKSTIELVEAVRKLDSCDAILLLPDVALLTTAALEEIYLSSFRKGIPVLGVSERSVKEGALLALVFDPVHVGRHIGEDASEAMRGVDIGRIPSSPPRNFVLYVNKSTAAKMKIHLPAELLQKARKAYP
ncbi:MAG: ABC transporter substrate binding protein [Nitrospiraceae bacterium]|nr:ABC transporter substrate binding protein [Nitrospiraceae bacterium]